MDVYRGKTKPAHSFSKLLLFVSMFPKLVMGPIVRYSEVDRQLDKRRTHPKAAFDGALRFMVGLAKKVLIADYAFRTYLEFHGKAYGGAAWLAGLFFMFYIYFEFSGVSDMAIGLARIFGFRYPENFNLPYTCTSVSEFWRRWHITLGSFFRDYVYIPLGGNRKGKGRQIFNLLVVWLLTGFWHGTSLNFLLWGLYFFVLVAAEKLLQNGISRLPAVIRYIGTMICIYFGWILFANVTMADLGKTLGMMFGSVPFWHSSVTVLFKNSVLLLLLCIVGSTPLPRICGQLFKSLGAHAKGDDRITFPRILYALGVFIFAVGLLYLCTASLAGANSVPSLYASF